MLNVKNVQNLSLRKCNGTRERQSVAEEIVVLKLMFKDTEYGPFLVNIITKLLVPHKGRSTLQVSQESSVQASRLSIQRVSYLISISHTNPII